VQAQETSSQMGVVRADSVRPSPAKEIFCGRAPSAYYKSEDVPCKHTRLSQRPALPGDQGSRAQPTAVPATAQGQANVLENWR
jgi:hypothetical protein